MFATVIIYMSCGQVPVMTHYMPTEGCKPAIKHVSCTYKLQITTVLSFFATYEHVINRIKNESHTHMNQTRIKHLASARKPFLQNKPINHLAVTVMVIISL